MRMIIFFTIAITLMVGAPTYLLFLSKRMLHNSPKLLKVVSRSIYVLTIISLLSFIFRDNIPFSISQVSLNGSYIWLGFIFTIFPIALFFDEINFIVRKIRGNNILHDHGKKLFIIGVSAFTLLTIYGLINARNPKIKTINYTIDNQEEDKDISIVAISDLHLSRISNQRHTQEIVDMINEQNADYIFLLGDIIDDNKIDQGVLKTFSKMKAKKKIISILGNHEYYRGIDYSLKKLNEANIITLTDNSMRLENSLLIVGRVDYTSERFGKKRSPLKSIIPKSNKLPVIVLDHNPKDLDQSMNANAFLQLSGHTHNGQIFPYNIVTNLMYEVSVGQHKKGNTNYYVHCGVGTWGPAIRTTCIPEILRVDIKLRKSVKL